LLQLPVILSQLTAELGVIDVYRFRLRDSRHYVLCWAACGSDGVLISGGCGSNAFFNFEKGAEFFE
jgi:hypothetical protein